MPQLHENQVYFVDGGYFTARYDGSLECWALWTYAGLAGSVIGRTGLDVTEEGQLYHRIYDVTNEEFILIASTLYIADLEEVSAQELEDIIAEQLL